jgi:hypothetical protein
MKKVNWKKVDTIAFYTVTSSLIILTIVIFCGSIGLMWYYGV